MTPPKSTAPPPDLTLLFQVLDRQARAAFLLDRFTGILKQNETARHGLSRESDLLVTTDRPATRLEFSNTVVQRDFVAALHAVTNAKEDTRQGPRDLRLRGEPHPLFGELYPMPFTGSASEPRPPAVLIFTRLDILDPHLERKLRLLYQLTSREAAVASKLAGALGEADIARDLNISGNTLRSHRKAIYAKLGITSRAAFSALVARLM